MDCPADIQVKLLAAHLAIEEHEKAIRAERAAIEYLHDILASLAPIQPGRQFLHKVGYSPRISGKMCEVTEVKAFAHRPWDLTENTPWIVHFSYRAAPFKKDGTLSKADTYTAESDINADV